jgi:hypothetical protein
MTGQQLPPPSGIAFICIKQYNTPTRIPVKIAVGAYDISDLRHYFHGKRSSDFELQM